MKVNYKNNYYKLFNLCIMLIWRLFYKKMKPDNWVFIKLMIELEWSRCFYLDLYFLWLSLILNHLQDLFFNLCYSHFLVYNSFTAFCTLKIVSDCFVCAIIILVIICIKKVNQFILQEILKDFYRLKTMSIYLYSLAWIETITISRIISILMDLRICRLSIIFLKR